MKNKQLQTTSSDICRYLKTRGMTRSEISKHLGICVSFLSRVARGERNFTLDHLNRLADTLEMTLPELLAAATPVEDIPPRLRKSYQLLLKGLTVTAKSRARRKTASYSAVAV